MSCVHGWLLCQSTATTTKISISPDKEQVERLFFERTYRFLCDRYGEQNVISAYVHKDEKTPHMHFAFVPVTEDKKRGGEKVSAKEVITKNDLKTFHTDLGTPPRQLPRLAL